MLNPNSPKMPPDLLNNRYHVLNLLGEGGFGQTFLVEDTQMPSARKCVVKQLKPVTHNPQIHKIVQERFQREAAILERLGEHHQQIPRLYAYFSEGEHFYLVEEWIEGDTLTQKVQREGVQSESVVRDILVKLLPTIADVHRHQIVHRDLKPDNVILRYSDAKPVLIDFGAVKEAMSTIINSQGNSSHSIVVGTPGYMPAEQLSGRPVYASDLYSLGITAIYLLTGKIPQELDTHPATGDILWHRHAPAVSPNFAMVIDRSIHMQLQHRFATAEEMLNALTPERMATEEMTIRGMVTPPPIVAQPTVLSISQPPNPPPNPIPVSLPTQAVFSTQPVSQPPIAAPSGEWKKPVIIGGIIGVSILSGALLLKGQLPGLSGEQKTIQSPALSPSPSPVVSPSPSSTPIAPPSNSGGTASNAPALGRVANTNASIVGEAGAKNIRSAPDTNANVLYTASPGDRIRVIGVSRNSDGYPWYKVFLPSGDDGWIAGQLVRTDTEIAGAAPPVSRSPVSTAPNTDAANTNATIIGQPGSKNIRSGAGTNFDTLHIAYPGDRVRIVGSTQDAGGFLWYRIYFPTSKAEGWIAAQLIQRD